MVTMADVARRARVSVSTVSHVMNDTRPVAEATLVPVLRAIQEIGYTPNRVARSLATARQNFLRAATCPPLRILTRILLARRRRRPSGSSSPRRGSGATATPPQTPGSGSGDAQAGEDPDDCPRSSVPGRWPARDLGA
jgi:hypothetical protein